MNKIKDTIKVGMFKYYNLRIGRDLDSLGILMFNYDDREGMFKLYLENGSLSKNSPVSNKVIEIPIKQAISEGLINIDLKKLSELI